mmetsp:Transcript_37097/g.57516  ORF Transcript_37097/g.57516 Transcript_37097/m.57516 type:complete len:233 (+) Transcript_37097:64-762(+)|eukprot:CAMPEP_0169120340 /NCGR_PEP_ID=MMETSP1015-20121227/32048_1 /TAXON_ID=342587 /ORGANISM="Karlodinium micrum, Strain CCMP2283" /LENGTH=232 /DNA_ID=CAMNT_0009183301 /DNA_START=78 /DNA_END=776 /DNA_ORIENTATION=+
MGNTTLRDTNVESGEAEGSHRVKLAATCFMSVAGVKCYHTSIILNNHEYWFDSLGIELGPAMWSHLVGKAKRKTELETEVIDFGFTSISGIAMYEALSPYFPRDHYDLLYKNCNHFTDCALYYLTGNRSEARFNRAESIMTSTDPISVTFMNKLARTLIERKTGEPCETDVYVRNPNTEDFSVEEVLEALDAEEREDDEEDDSEDEEVEYGCAKMHYAPPCMRGCNNDVNVA